MNEQQKVIALFHKYLSRTAGDEEKQEFLNFVDDPAYTDLIQHLIADVYEQQEEPAGLSDAARTRILQHIFNEFERAPKAPKVFRLWPRIAAAASIILALAAGSYFMFRHAPVQQTAQLIKNDVAPGNQRATLTLANGQKIILTKGLSGQLAKQDQTTINASQNTIVYQANDQYAAKEVYNTLSTAIGEQSPYPLVLADGTKVWLNAASSITFPIAFNSKERLVKVTGEAYFEVVHNARKPFRLEVQGQTIEDVGTQFNINSYSNEPAVKTTLVEGAVRIQLNTPGSNNIRLFPGQQAQIAGQQVHIQTVNTARVTAWKDGNFRFQNDDIQTIMRQLVRWYNIEVYYQGKPPADKFSGRISRQNPISAVLHMMELTNHVHFKIEGRRVTVIQ